MSSWSKRIPIGNKNLDNRDECLSYAVKKDRKIVGIYWSYIRGNCRAIIDIQSILPWPNSFPIQQDSVNLCVMTHLIKKGNDCQNLNCFGSKSCFELSVSKVKIIF